MAIGLRVWLWLVALSLHGIASSHLAAATVVTNEPLAFVPVDAEFDHQHDRLVVVSGNPSYLRMWSSGAWAGVALPAAPLCVSISPDGSQAVVGHAASISCVSLPSLAVTAIWPVPVASWDIVHGGNGHAYVLPDTVSFDSIRTVNLANGQIVVSAWSAAHGRSNARLQPGRQVLYTGDNDISPTDVHRYDLVGHEAVPSWDSPYHGDYQMGGSLWFDEGGRQVITKNGTIFRTADERSRDLLYVGHMPDPELIIWADHCAVIARYALIRTGQEQRVQLVHDDLLQHDQFMALPALPVAGAPTAAGRWAFLFAGGSRLLALVQEAGAMTAPRQALQVLDLGLAPQVTWTSPVPAAIIGRSFSCCFRAQGVPTGGAVVLRLDGVDVGDVVAPRQVRDLAPGAHVAELRIRTSAGATVGMPASIAFTVAADQPSVQRLTDDLIAACYDEAHDRIICVGGKPPVLQCISMSSHATVPLPATPICVSVSPDGNQAVVGCVDRIVVVDLALKSILASWPVADGAYDVVHGGEGHAYLVRRIVGYQPMIGIDLVTGENRISTYSYFGQARLRLRPGPSPAIYVADRSSSTPDFLHVDMMAGTPVLVRDSPYFGDYTTGTELWFLDGGTRLVGITGQVFRAGDDAATDLTYAGTLPVRDGIICADSSQATANLAVVWRQDRTRIRMYGEALLEPAGELVLPALATRQGAPATLARWIFLSSDGATVHAIVQAEGSGYAWDHALISMSATPPPEVAITWPRSGGRVGSDTVVSANVVRMPPGASARLVVDGNDLGAFTDTTVVRGLTPGLHDLRIELRDGLGVPIAGASSTAPFTAVAEPQDLKRIAGEVVDCGYDRARDRLVFVSADPPLLQAWSPASWTVLSLPRQPACLSVSPDGTQAAVGLDGAVAIVDLMAMRTVSMLPVPAPVTGVVHDGAGQVHAFGAGGPWTVRLSDGHLGPASFADSGSPRLRPGTTDIYAIYNGLSHFSGGGSVLSLIRSSWRPGDFPRGGVRAFTQAGDRAITWTRDVVFTSDDAARDLGFAGRLPGTALIECADHAPSTGRIAYVRSEKGDVVTVAADDQFGLLSEESLPLWSDEAVSKPLQGRWLFAMADGQRVREIVSATGVPLESARFGVATVPIARPAVAIRSPGSDAVIDPRTTLLFTTDGMPTAGGSVRLAIDGIDQGVVTSPWTMPILDAGPHTLRLDLCDAGGPIGVSDSVAVTVDPPVSGWVRLPNGMRACERDPVHDRMVLIGNNPEVLLVWSPGNLRMLPLPKPPLCVSVDPTGTEAVIGADGLVMAVDLDSLTLRRWPCTAPAFSIVHGGNGYAYVLPEVDQSQKIRSVNLVSGAEALSSPTVYAGTYGRRRPNSQALYLAPPAWSNERFWRFSIAGPVASFERTGPWSPDSGTGGFFCFDSAGQHMLAGNGLVFRATETQATDMSQSGQLPWSGGIISADHSATLGGFIAIPIADRSVARFATDGMNLAGEVTIPRFWSGTPALGRWVAVSVTGGSLFAVSVRDGSLPSGGEAAIGVIPLAPTITSTPVVTGEVGVPYSYEIQGQGIPTPVLHVEGLPSWLTLVGGTTVQGTPPSPGTYGPITIRASSGNGSDAEQHYSLVVSGAPPALPPTATPGGSAGGCATGSALACLLAGVVLGLRRQRLRR